MSIQKNHLEEDPSRSGYGWGNTMVTSIPNTKNEIYIQPQGIWEILENSYVVTSTPNTENEIYIQPQKQFGQFHG
jgi:hypothetical protein